MNIFVFGTRGIPNIQGGVEKHCEELYSEMPEKYCVTVLRRKSFLHNDVRNQYKQIRLIDLASTKIKGFESFFHSFLAALYCIVHKPDIVHIHNIGPGIFIPLLKIFRRRVVLTYHSPNYEHKKWNRLTRFLLKTGEKIALNGADAIIFVNNEQLHRFNVKIQKKSFYIPNGVKLIERTSQTESLDKYNLIRDEYILAVGRITSEKGFDYLIDAFLSLSDKKYKLVIAGKADHKTSYSKMIYKKSSKQDRIVTTGFVNGEVLRQLYSHAKLIVIPSYNEGFSLVLLEAMSYKQNILVSDIPAMKSMGLPAESYFQVGNKENLLQKLNQKLANSHSMINYDLSAYSWETIVTQTIDVYEQSMSDRLTKL